MATNMAPVAQYRTIPLDHLELSQTRAQVERREHFDKGELKKLAESINTLGLAHPIVVRVHPHSSGKFEVIAGERRVLAVESLGWDDIQATVRELDDEQVLELQLIENLQREGLHELAEAEGYEQLLKMGHSAEEVAAKLSKSKGYVYGRMKLLALCAEVRSAFYEGKVSASVALLLARIPGEEQQLRALKQITDGGYHGDRVMTYREVAAYVQENFTLKLSGAPFPRDDETLVPSAGTCGACPMRTGNQPELFEDVKGADVCTNPSCFQAKKAAHAKRELEKAKATGEPVIRGGDARRILPQRHAYDWSGDGSHRQLRNGYARPGDKCLDDPKKRTYAELAGKDATRVLLQNPDTGRVEKVFEIATIAEQLKAKGVKVKPPAKDKEEQRERDTAQQKAEEQIEISVRRAIFQAILKAAPTTLSHLDLATLISRMACSGHGDDEEFYLALGWSVPKGVKRSFGGAEGQRLFLKRLLECTDAELAKLAVAITAIDDVAGYYVGDEGEELEALAQRFHIDTKKMRHELAPAPAKDEKPAPKKATKKKAPRKSK